MKKVKIAMKKQINIYNITLEKCIKSVIDNLKYISSECTVDEDDDEEPSIYIKCSSSFKYKNKNFYIDSIKLLMHYHAPINIEYIVTSILNSLNEEKKFKYTASMYRISTESLEQLSSHFKKKIDIIINNDDYRECCHKFYDEISNQLIYSIKDTYYTGNSQESVEYKIIEYMYKKMKNEALI